MAITINGSGTITGISAGGLPDGSVTAADLASGAITSGALPSGSVLQVVQDLSTTTSEFTTTGTWHTTDSSVTITPSSISSKILILHTAGGLWSLATASASARGIRLTRNGNQVIANDRYGYSELSGWRSAPWSLVVLDSPAANSALTYTIQIGMDGAGNNIRHNDADSWAGGLRGASLIAMEIAG